MVRCFTAFAQTCLTYALLLGNIRLVASCCFLARYASPRLPGAMCLRVVRSSVSAASPTYSCIYAAFVSRLASMHGFAFYVFSVALYVGGTVQRKLAHVHIYASLVSVCVCVCVCQWLAHMSVTPCACIRALTHLNGHITFVHFGKPAGAACSIVPFRPLRSMPPRSGYKYVLWHRGRWLVQRRGHEGVWAHSPSGRHTVKQRARLAYLSFLSVPVVARLSHRRRRARCTLPVRSGRLSRQRCRPPKLLPSTSRCPCRAWSKKRRPAALLRGPASGA